MPIDKTVYRKIDDCVWLQKRRSVFCRLDRLHILVDTRRMLDVGAKAAATVSMEVPLDGSYLQIFGLEKSSPNPILLAIVSVPEYESLVQTSHMCDIVCEGGHKLKLTFEYRESQELRLVKIDYQEPRLLSAILRKAKFISLIIWRECKDTRLADVAQGVAAAAWSTFSGRVARLWRPLPVALALAPLLFLTVNQRMEIQRLRHTVAENQMLQEIRNSETSRFYAEVASSIQREGMGQMKELENRLPQLMQGRTFDTLVTLGSAFLYNQEFDKAVLVLERAKQIRPDHGEPYKALAAIYKLQSRHLESVQNLQAFLDRSPQDQETLNFLGWSYYLLGNYPKAREAYELALRVRPDYADAIFNLALIELEEGNRSAYRRMVERARRLLQDELSANPHSATAHFQLAKVYAQEKSWNQAFEYLKTAIAIDPAWAFWARYEGFFKEMVQNRPEDGKAVNALAELYRANKIKQVLATIG